MAVLQDYKCPYCDGSITFDSVTQNMKCPFCGSEFDVASLAHVDEKLEDTGKEEQSADNRTTGEYDGLVTYGCNMCGGQIVGDSTLAATECPFCGSAVVMMGQFKGELRPDIIIPFKMDKEDAKKALQKHYLGKRLLPKSFKDKNHIDEVKGLYVPFWLFNVQTEGNVKYKATRVRAWSDSKYNYTETSFYSVNRAGTLDFACVPVDGSKKMPDMITESIEPYDLSEAVDFQTAYLAGYFADKYDVDAETGKQRIKERAAKSTEEIFASTVNGYATVSTESADIRISNGTAKYALLPVWLLNTTWNGEKYVFAMNGQTGKFVGDMPLDKGAYKKWLFGLGGIISAAALLASYLIWLL